MTSVFTYGSLVVPEVWTVVAGRLHASEPALLPGYRRRKLLGAPYPGIAPAIGERVEGILWHAIEADELVRLDDFEGDIYERLVVEVRVGGELVLAEAYVIRPDHEALLSAEPWDEERFRERDLARYLEGCRRFADSWPRPGA